MEFEKTLYSRHATRSYSSKEVSTQALQNILAAGEDAPAGMGEYEKFHFTTITSQSVIQKIEAKTGGHPYYGAAAVIIISAKQGNGGIGTTEAIATGAMVENMALAATDQALSTCVILGALVPLVSDSELLKEIGVPTDFVPCISLAVGYGKQVANKPEKGRHSVEQNFLK